MSLTEGDIDEYAKEQASLDQLRQAHNRVLRQLEAAKASKAELVEAVRAAARDAVAGLSIPRVVAVPKDTRKGTPEVAIHVCSDWQLAKATPTYNSDVCARRVEEYGDRAIQLARIQRSDHPVTEARLYLLGDLLEGELVFPGQAHRIDGSLFRQVMTTGPQILASLIRRLAGEYQKVRVVGVIGNHGSLGGRARKEYHPETNADAMLMEVTRLITDGLKNVEWAPNVTEGERHWYAVDYVGDHGFLLYHGDQVRGGGHGGHPWYGFAKRLLGWRTSGKLPAFSYSLSGHFHTPNRMYLNGLTNWGNGSLESDNTYALEELGAAGEPCQWLLFAHPKRGVTGEYLVKVS